MYGRKSTWRPSRRSLTTVGTRDVPRFVNLHQSRDAQHRVGAKRLRIDKVVVDSSINDIDALEPLCRAHPDKIIRHHQVVAFDQFNPHLLREKGMLEVS